MRLLSFKRSGIWDPKSLCMAHLPRIGGKGFLRLNHHRLVTKRGERFACNRAQWTTVRNIKQMYDVIYDEFVDAGISIYREKHVFTDKEGTEVDESERFGLIQDILITVPITFCLLTRVDSTPHRRTTERLAERN